MCQIKNVGKNMKDEIRNFFDITWKNTIPSENGLGLIVTNYSTLVTELYEKRLANILNNPEIFSNKPQNSY